LLAFSRLTNVKIVNEQNDLGYSIAGGFHTWCHEQKIHNLTIEIGKGMGQFEIKDRYLSGLVQFLESISGNLRL
ncbi:MAG: hypothetical protein ACK58T_37460, partial [Phycisphaerae bacterium]